MSQYGAKKIIHTQIILIKIYITKSIDLINIKIFVNLKIFSTKFYYIEIPHVYFL